MKQLYKASQTIWKPGIYENIPFEEYLWIPAISKSKLVNILKSPKHYKHGLLKDDDETVAKRKGAALDTMVFDGLEKYRHDFAVKPSHIVTKDGKTKEWHGSIKECKEFVANAKACGRRLISAAEDELVISMYNNLQENEDFQEYFVNAEKKSQITLIWVDPDTGLLCKGRPDWVTYLPNDIQVINDLKTSKDISQDSFAKDVFNYNYHIQGAFYTDGWAALNDGVECGFQFTCIENIQPHDSRLFRLGDMSITIGRSMYKKALKDIHSSIQNDNWHGYHPRKTTTDIPRWAVKQSETIWKD